MNNSLNMRSTTIRIIPFGYIIIVGLLLTVVEYAAGFFGDDKALSYLYIVQLCIIFGVSYAECVMRLGWLHLFSLLHFSTFVFMISAMFLSLFNSGFLIREVVSPARATFSEPVIQHVALIFSAYIATSNLVYFSNYSNGREEIELEDDYIAKEGLFNVGRVLLIIGLPFTMWVNIFYLLNVSRVAAYLAGSRGAIGLPLWVRMFDTLTIVGYLLISASKPPYKKFVFYTILYSLPMIPLLLYGERGDPLMVVLFFFWYRYRFYKKKVKFVYLAIMGFAIILLAYFIQDLRQGIMLSGNAFQLLISFFGGSSTTVKLTSFYVQFADKIPHHYPFFLDQAISGLFGIFGESYTGQSLHTLAGRSALGHQLTYYVNANYYLAGSSMGTAWVTECYEFGLVGVMIGGAVLAKFVQLLDTRIIKSSYWSIFLFEFFSLIILSPRGSLLPSIYSLLKYTIIVAVVMGAYNIVTHRRKY